MYWLGVIHDWSKLTPSEFIPYARWFYGFFGEGWSQEKYGGCGDEIKLHNETKNNFDMAWLFHQKRNRHHWQFWYLIQDNDPDLALQIPKKYAREMLADWRGASKAITGKDNTKDWYSKNRDKIKLEPTTRSWIKRQLGII